MKIDPVKIILLSIGILFCNPLFASNNPPPPSPPPPPGLPIDGELLILTFSSLILGFYKIYKYKKTLRIS